MIELPRVEAEFNYNSKFGENSNFKLFLNGAAQTAKNGVAGTTKSLSSTGGAAASRSTSPGSRSPAPASSPRAWARSSWATRFVGDGRRSTATAWTWPATAATRSATSARSSTARPDSKFGIGGSFGREPPQAHRRRQGRRRHRPEILKRRAIVGQITYKWSKSLRWVAEYGHIDGLQRRRQGLQGAIRARLGMMLFF